MIEYLRVPLSATLVLAIFLMSPPYAVIPDQPKFQQRRVAVS